jgi:hypothetical protein
MRTVILVVLGLCALAASAAADGPKLVNGHLPQPVTVLKLTDSQLLTVRTKRVFFLTAEQRATLKKRAGVAPSVIEVFSKRAIEGGIDGCFLYNWSYWLSEREVEVPHAGLVSDEEAVKKANDLEEI